MDFGEVFPAALKGDLRKATELLDAGAPLEARSPKSGETVLITASKSGHQEIVRALLDRHANVNADDYQGNTALQFASLLGHVPVVVCPNFNRPGCFPMRPSLAGLRCSRRRRGLG